MNKKIAVILVVTLIGFLWIEGTVAVRGGNKVGVDNKNNNENNVSPVQNVEVINQPAPEDDSLLSLDLNLLGLGK